MRGLAVAAVLAVGCLPATKTDEIPALCECFSRVAYEVVRAETVANVKPESCCGKCNNTGKARSGDGLSIVPCPCPPTCKCKQAGAKK